MAEQQPPPVYLKNYEVPTCLIDEIHLQVDLFDEVTYVTSRLHVRHNRFSANKSKELVLNGEELQLEFVKLDGKQLSPAEYQMTSQHLILHEVPETFDLEIKTRIYPQKNTTLSGLYRSGNTYCTQCEAEGFRRITFYLDRPDVLSRYTTTITADEKSFPVLLSNGNLVGSGKEDEGRHWARWHDPFNKPSYLFALVAGDFDLLQDTFVTQSGREILLKIFVEKGEIDQASHAMYALKQAMRWDEQAFGREYDLDTYMIVAIGDFNMGAMENKGLNIFNTKYILAKPETATDLDYIHILSVIGHEYFHNWSGNRVTCRDWFQLSLKEGLTIFREQLFTEDMLSPQVMRIHEVNALRESQFPEDAGPLAHPVRPDSYIEINNFYTTTIYNKGAEVLRMLRTILGNELFRKGMDLYFARHDGQAVTIEDYVKAMEDVSGIDLRQFRLWYSQAGTPIVNVEEDYDAENKIWRLTLTQGTPPTPHQPDKQPLYIPVRMALLDQAGNEIPLFLNDALPVTEKVLPLTKASQLFEFKNVMSLPVPSLLRNFSAPVKLNHASSDSSLEFLLKHDTDAFNRWEAGQKYATRILLNLVQDYRHGTRLSLPQGFLHCWKYILQTTGEDKFLQAELLMIPAEKYIGEQMTIIDVEAIHATREFMLTEIASQLQTDLLAVYKENHEAAESYLFSMSAVGKRQLKNRCLSYLIRLPAGEKWGQQQFDAALATNMSDTLPVLSGMVNQDSPLRHKMLEQFYATWKKNALVIDKWLAVQAASTLPDALQVVKRLMRHEAFDIKNPNKVYALIGTFANHNAINFHALNGEGYAFLREVVHQLDKLNPQIASRMVKPLTTFQRYDKERQALMQTQLEVLLQDQNISRDLYELVTKALAHDKNTH